MAEFKAGSAVRHVTGEWGEGRVLGSDDWNWVEVEWPTRGIVYHAPEMLVAVSPAPDLVNQPPHYTTGGIETIDFIRAKQLDYCLGNVVKYITRAPHKGNEVQDLEKARWYLDRAISERTEGDGEGGS